MMKFTSVYCFVNIYLYHSLPSPFISVTSLPPPFPFSLLSFGLTHVFTVHTMHNTVNDTFYIHTNNKVMSKFGYVWASWSSFLPTHIIRKHHTYCIMLVNWWSSPLLIIRISFVIDDSGPYFISHCNHYLSTRNIDEFFTDKWMPVVDCLLEVLAIWNIEHTTPDTHLCWSNLSNKWS